MEEKTYSVERVIPDSFDIARGVEQYYILIRKLARNIAEHSPACSAPREIQKTLNDDTEALLRVVEDMGAFVKDVWEYNDLEDKKGNK